MSKGEKFLLVLFLVVLMGTLRASQLELHQAEATLWGLLATIGFWFIFVVGGGGADGGPTPE